MGGIGVRVMRVVLAALVSLVIATGSAAASGTWKITKDHWEASDEEGFGKFVAGFGESDCKDPASCFKSTANPYRDSDPPELKMDGDCADFIYQLRAYYAWKNGLPFSYELYTIPRTWKKSDDDRFSDAGNMVMARLQVEWQADADPVHLLRDLRGIVSTASFRIEDTFDRGYQASDFYSPKIQRGSIKPGSVIYDPFGHVVYVYKVDDDGTIHYVDSNPDRQVTRGTFGSQFMRDDPKFGSGFRNFRPIKLVEYQTAPDGSLINGHFVLAANSEIPDYSAEQYYGNPPSPDHNWKNAQFKAGGKTVDFYNWVKLSLADK
jgi:hypothetical protein